MRRTIELSKQEIIDALFEKYGIRYDCVDIDLRTICVKGENGAEKTEVVAVLYER